MDNSTIVFIRSVDGYVLNYSKKELQENPIIKGTIIEKIFFGTNFTPKNELILQYKANIMESLIFLIREGLIYLPVQLNEEHDLYKNATMELSKMLDFISGENQNIANMSGILRYGAMDLFGRKVKLPAQIYISDLFYLSPYNKKESKQREQSFIDKIIIILGMKNLNKGRYCANNLQFKNDDQFKVTDFIDDYFNPLYINIIGTWITYKIDTQILTIFDSRDSYANEIIERIIVKLTK